MSRFDIQRHMAGPRYLLGLLGLQTPTGSWRLAFCQSAQSVIFPSSGVAGGRPLTFRSRFVILHHQEEGSHDPIGFVSIQPNRTCASTPVAAPAGQPPPMLRCSSTDGRLDLGRVSQRVCFISEPLGRRTSPPITRPGGTIDPWPANSHCSSEIACVPSDCHAFTDDCTFFFFCFWNPRLCR